MNCKLNIPYPEAKTDEKNLCYANLLLNDYAGKNSEMTAVTQYTYQDIISTEMYPEVADALECIAIVEMHHYDLIATVIREFGGDPQLRVINNGQPRYWDAKYVNYNKNPRRFLRENIIAEKAAIESYKKRIRQINDPNVQKLLERIIIDEEHHIEIFQSLLDDLK